MRENAGFEITGSIQVDPHTEVVIGHRHKDDSWVCWYYDKDNDYYFWGRYTDTFEDAENVCIERMKQPWR